MGARIKEPLDGWFMLQLSERETYVQPAGQVLTVTRRAQDTYVLTSVGGIEQITLDLDGNMLFLDFRNEVRKLTGSNARLATPAGIILKSEHDNMPLEDLCFDE